MNVLVIGRGGREHSMVKKLAESPMVDKVFVAPGNAGMKEAVCVSINENDHLALIEFAKKNQVEWTLVGPEIPLLNGIVDAFQEENLKIFGPTKAAALIEGSKEFAKDLMRKYDIPTATYQAFVNPEAAKVYVEKIGVPIVIKADGLAAGKGVVVAFTKDEAFQAIDRMLKEGQFGEASQRIVVEEFLEGEEFSLMAFVNGEHVYPMIVAQDHKRAFDEDKGPNTGGMGAYAPVPHIKNKIIDEAVKKVLIPTAKGLVKEGRTFKGILYAGLIVTNHGPKVIEFNARFGDPETQVVLPLLQNDLLQVVNDIDKKQDPNLKWKNAFCVGTVLAAKGYPESYDKGWSLPTIATDDAFVIYAGVKKSEQQLVSDGGRVLLVGALSNSIETAQSKVYHALKVCDGDDQFFFRKDIAKQALKSDVFQYKQIRKL